PLERRAPDVVQPVPAEGMRHRHDAALIVDARDGVLGREVARDGLLEEEPDDLAIAAGDLLADDHADAVGDLTHPERSLDRVVIGRAHDIDTGRPQSGQLRLERRATVGAVLAVRVHVELDAAHAGVRPLSNDVWTIARMRSRNRDTSKRR